jgi:hypothetical protein
VTVTGFPLPTFLLSKCAAYAELSIDTASGAITPESVAPAKLTVASSVPSYVLLFAEVPLMIRFFLAIVSVAAFEIAEPQVLVKTARYLFPLEETGGLMKLRVGLVAPGRSLKLAPPFVLTCHCTVGLPPAAAVNEAFAP